MDDKRKYLFVKIDDDEDRRNINFVTFATSSNVSKLTRLLFSQEAQRIKSENPELWQSYLAALQARANDD